jgi:phosphatidylglycerol phospholipase C
MESLYYPMLAQNLPRRQIHLLSIPLTPPFQDPSLQRCYGVKKKIADCDWAYLKTLRTLQAPHEPMPRLVDILDYLRQPELDHIWVLLDIKVLLPPRCFTSPVLTSSTRYPTTQD